MVALAVLMPIVASMGGIAGSQTLTLIIRGLALGQITPQTYWTLMRKELGVGAINGVLWALVIAGITYLWFGDWIIATVISLAIVINICVAAFSGVVIPVWLEKNENRPCPVRFSDLNYGDRRDRFFCLPGFRFAVLTLRRYGFNVNFLILYRYLAAKAH